MPDGRVLVAFDDPWDEPTPTWTRLDSDANLVSSMEIRRGRQTELDQTDTSTAVVQINDTEGLFDPGNMSSPYFGELDGKQVMLQLYDPVAAAWVTQYRGFVDDYTHDFDPAMGVARVTLEAVDLFEYLAGVEMIPGLFGDTDTSGESEAGVVFYEDTDFQTRITQLLTDAGLPPEFFEIFTGNVDIQETRYDPGDSILAAVRDAVDAEFPGIANVYVDKRGRVVAHGRRARFDPETTAVGSDWDFTRWEAATGGAVVALDMAQVRPPLRWSRPRSRIINAALAYPQYPIRGAGGGTFTEADIPGQIYDDATSRTAYGYRSWSATNLLTLRNFNNSNDAKTETALFAQYYVDNYKQPRTRVEALTFRSIDPDDSRALKTWALICGVDISDIVELTTGYPGGVGLSEDFYVEGSEMSVRPLNPEYDLVELTLNVSPAAYFTVDVFS